MKKATPFVLAALLMVLAISCEKEPQVVPPPTFSISTIVIGKGLVIPEKLQGITLGSDVNFKFTPETEYSLYSVKINGVKVEDIYPSSTEAQYIVRGVNKNLNMEVNFVETNILLLSKLEPAWRLTKLELYKASDNTFIATSNLAQEEKARRLYHYYPSMEVKVINPDGTLYWSGKWNLAGDVYEQGNQTLKKKN